MDKQTTKAAVTPDCKLWTCETCEGTMFALECPKYCLHCGDDFKPLKNLNNYSWSEIEEIFERGNAQEYFNIGDEKEVTLYTGERVKVKLIDLYGADKVEAGGNVLGTFMFFIDGEWEMNETATNKGGWKESKMRTVYMPRFMRLLPDDLRKVIKTVEKNSSCGEGSTDLYPTLDKLFLPSEIEITGQNRYSVKGEGEQFEWFKKNKPPEKCFWLRSPDPGDSYCFACWYGCGYVDCGNANGGCRVALCFCL